MSKRNSLLVTMELLSDTIFGSGYSIPGGEDIAVCQDENGYPYLKGSTLKGLLRESLASWLVWTDGDESQLTALMGESVRGAADESKKIHLTELRLADEPSDAASCYATRTFTEIEGGVVKPRSLRVAACIRSGLRFQGEIECDKEDNALLKNALMGIKWAGTLRSRGFGRVRVTAEEKPPQTDWKRLNTARCIRYRLVTESPVMITDLCLSRGNNMESRSCIPGSAIRGLVINAIADVEPDWFETHRTTLLSEGTRFLDAIPVCGEVSVLPSLMGFYEDKAETKFCSIVKDGSVPAGLKRAKIGAFCSLNHDTLRFWSAAASGSARIKLSGGSDTELFQTRYLEAGQTLEGYILLENESFAEQISAVFNGTVWLGADRFSGFGKCSVTELEACEKPAWLDTYGYSRPEDLGTELYLLAVSPFTMLDESGTPCGLDEDALADILGVGSIELVACSTAVREYGGYNRTLKSRMPAAQMYERGSLFHLRCDRVPEWERLLELQQKGLGIRRAEGFGELLFLRPELLENIRCKKAVELNTPAGRDRAAEKRRAKVKWVMANADRLRFTNLSPSQLGGLQAVCERALRKKGDLTELENWLGKNEYERGAQHGERFRGLGAWIRELLRTETAPSGGIPEEFSIPERLELLCLLCDFSRKEREEGET